MLYTEFNRGSEWRKWDLHVHTPLSYHQAFPNWDDYIKELKEKSVDHGIEVMGVTDYFSTDGYEKLLEECEPDFKDTNPRIKLSNGQSLFLIPIVELRLDNFTDDSSSVNIHIAFSPEILPSTIKDSFLEKLDITYQGKTLQCKESDLIKIGHAEENNGSFNVNLNISSLNDTQKKQLIRKAQSIITFSSSSFEDKLYSFEKTLEDAGIHKNSYLILIANKGHGGLDGFKWVDSSRNISRAGIIRQNLLHLSDICFSNNTDDIKFLCGEKPGTSKQEIISRFRSIKPCIWGSDAHDVKNLFSPSNGATKDYTWIKADPTFEGLRQTLFEPNDRVKIQTLKPDVKNERYIISELQFNDKDELFGSQTIALNENLNAIIGGKSSGKSLLLYTAAKSIDPEQVKHTSERLKFDGYQFEKSFEFEVIWKNGDRDNFNDPLNKQHAITYIPQLYINYLVERDNKEDLNSLIRSILLQDSDFKQFYEAQANTIRDLNNEIEQILSNYLQTRVKYNDLLQKLKQVGKSDAIDKGISAIKTEIQKGQKAVNFSASESEEYNKLAKENSELKSSNSNLSKQKSVLEKIVSQVEFHQKSLFGEKESGDSYYIKGEVNKILDELTEIPDYISQIITKLSADYQNMITNLKTEIRTSNNDQNIKTINDRLKEIEGLLKPYLDKLAGQQELKKLTERLDNELQKKEQALNLEKQLATVKYDYDNLRQRTSELLNKRLGIYKTVINKINTSKNNIAQGITLTSRLIYKRSNFDFYDQANKVAIPRDHYFNTLFEGDLVKYDLISPLYSQFLRVSDGKLLVGDKEQIPLRQGVLLEEVLKGLIKDNFEIDYTVKYKSDDLLSMSPGKKGTVLLILFLQISSSEYPILIDQPEDNLDNRTIYDLLCQIIKEKKKERQIIIVSHNANLVVATDTENIIVANQEGQESPIKEGHFRFEYVNGSLEHTFERNDSGLTILEQKGIREHVCDILEGGNEAFKQREYKYSIKD